MNNRHRMALAALVVVASIVIPILVLSSMRGGDEAVNPDESEKQETAGRGGGESESPKDDLDPSGQGLSAARHGRPADGEQAEPQPAEPGEPDSGKGETEANPAEPMAGAVISGRVTDRDGLPLEGVEVRLLEYPAYLACRKKTETGPDGRYCIQAVELGEYKVEAVACKPFSISSRNAIKHITVSPGDAEKTIDLCVDPIKAECLCRVFGRVLRLGEAVVKTKVGFASCAGLGEAAALTGKDGEYEIRDLPAGKYIISILFARFAVEVPQTAEFEQYFSMPTATAEGRVLDAVTKEPVSWAWVSFAWDHPWMRGEGGSTACQTDEDGKYEFKELAAGKYYFHVFAEKYRTLEKPGVEILESRVNKGIDLFVTRGSVLVGVVLDPGGRKLADEEFEVAISEKTTGFKRSMTSCLDEDSSFRDEGIDAGVVNVCVSVPGYAPCRMIAVRLQDGGETRLEFRLSAGGTVQIQALDSAGKPKAGARFALMYEDGETMEMPFDSPALVTDADGVLTVEHVPAGKIVIARVDGGVPASSSETVFVPEGGVVERTYVVK